MVEVENPVSDPYPPTLLAAMYELGRMYYETGYFAPAERIFSGLVAVDAGQTPARLALAVVKLERGLYPEATAQFRLALQSNFHPLRAKLGLGASFVAQGDFARARSVFNELERDPQLNENGNSEVRGLLEALLARTG